MTEKLAWRFVENNPVIRPGSLGGELDRAVAGAASVIRVGDSYRMYYWGSGRYPNCICLAETPVEQPHAWRFVECLIAPQPGTAHNCNGPRWPWAVTTEDGRVRLYYCARGDPARHRYPNTYRVQVSEDGGRTFREIGDRPLLTAEKAYEQEAFGSCCVVRAETEWRLYYTAFAGYIRRPEGAVCHDGERLPHIGIGFARSDDGLQWTRPHDSWLIGPRYFGCHGYEYKVAKPCVVRDAQGWRMWISCLGAHYTVESLVSRDGLHWIWQDGGPQGCLGVGAPGAFDDLQRCYPMVVYHNGVYHCWYTGNGFGRTGMGHAVAHGI